MLAEDGLEFVEKLLARTLTNLTTSPARSLVLALACYGAAR